MKSSRQLEHRQRQLTAAEIRLLRAQASSLQRRGRRGLSAGLWVGIAVIAILWALTLLASDAPAIVITGFWLVVGTVIILWVRRDFGRDQTSFDAMAAGLESAARRNLALVYDIHASGFVEFEEIEDEGACYAFQLMGRDELVFLSGQELYEDARFPCVDFSLVFPLDEAGGRVDMLIEKRSGKARPDRVIPASVKHTLDFPDDLEILVGTLGNVEEILRTRRVH